MMVIDDGWMDARRVEAKMEQLASDPGNPPCGWPC
jgi:hypothetical protein